MSFSPGARLGPYEIVGLLGEGGMGEVYRATDTRLDRSVAIKILPDAVASDPERRLRFEREARAIASLSHPHVCALHDVGSSPSAATGRPVEYLVMEYLDGDTLATRLARGPLPLPELIRFGAEIAAALEAAHRHRIVHRDLKPSNVMLTRSGVKLLDFGLAKAVETPSADASGVSAVTAAMTTPGTILGTLPYMSPEQIEGRETDARSDIFALGAVLYEMATGRRAFGGDSPAAVASAILSSEPPPIAASPSLDRIVRGCLRKDPDRRWQSAQDVGLQLGDVEDRDRGHITRVGAGKSTVLPWLIAGIAAAVAVASLVIAWRQRSVAPAPSASAPASPLKFTIPVGRGDDAYLALSVERLAFAISPDGRSVAMAGGNGEGAPAVWIRQLSADTASMLPGTEGATSVFWSPDSRSLGFFALGKLKRVDLTGGAPVTLCDVRQGIGQTGTWGATQILFASVQGEDIFSVHPSGGTPVSLLKPNPSAGENRVPWPSFLPDGRHFLYLSSRGPEKGAVMLRAPDGTTREVLPVRSNSVYVEPFLIYGQDGVVLARRFDPAKGQISGEPIALAEGVTQFGATGLTQFSASSTGAIVVHSGRSVARVLRIDRQGRVVAEVRGPNPYEGVRLSRDGRELFVDRSDPETSRMDIWKIDLERGGESRITSDVAAALNPTFAADGSMIFSAARTGPPELYRRPASGPDEVLLPKQPGMQVAADISPDGRWVIYSQRTPRGNFDLLAISMVDRAVTPFQHSNADEAGGRFSPDGRFIAFSSDLGGRRDVYVAPFPGPGSARIVSTTAASLARWSADGSELFYVGADGTVYAAAIRTAGALEIGKPQTLFTRGVRARWASYEPTRDGEFIALEPVASAAQQPLRVILNWPSAR